MERALNIAIVSTNKNKYSETFIHNHVKLLKGKVHFLFEGYFPLRFSADRGLTDHSFLPEEIPSGPHANELLPINSQIMHEQALENYLSENKIDLVFCEYGPSGVEMMALCRKLSVPLVVHFFGYDAYRDDILNSYGKKYKALFEIAKAVVGVSAHMCLQLKKLGCDESKLHCMPCGIDLSIYSPHWRSDKKITFVSCGRFVEKKGPKLTIEAFAMVLTKVPQANLVMIGDGELLEECMLLSEKLGISNRIEFTGKLEPAEISEIYRSSLVFVQHSISTQQNDQEGTPLSILESGACGLPVISTIHGGISDVIMDGETGFLVTEGDTNGMALKMIFLAENPEVAANMGQKAAEKMRRSYSLMNYTLALDNLIKDCVKH